jgi:hypothetical protein
MHRLAFLALTIAAVAAACGGGSDRPTPTPDPTQPAFVTATPAPPEPSPTQRPTGVPTATPTPFTVDGILPVTLRPGAPVPFPDDVAIDAYDGVWEGPSQALRRYYRDPSGELRIDNLIVSMYADEEDESRGFVGVVFGANASELAAGLCHGFCYGGWQPVTVIKSRDGGMTWAEVGVVAEGGWDTVAGIAGGDVLVRSVVGGLLTNARPLTLAGLQEPLDYPPAVEPDAKVIVWTLRGQSSVLGLGIDERTLWNLDGSDTDFFTIPLPPSAEVDGWDIRFVDGRNAEELVVRWSFGGSTGYLGFVDVRTQQFRDAYRWERSYGVSGVRVTQWLTETSAIGYARFDLGGYVSTSGDDTQKGVPAMIDFEAGIVSPIAEFLALSVGKAGGPRPVSAETGPFARVTAGDTCLNVRSEPATDAAVLGCYADAVLLRTTLETTEAGGRTWLAITTPTGESGWAAAEFLEYR